MQNEKNVVQNFSGGCNACVWSVEKQSVWLQKTAC
jgi:hypothetical protein